jgi:hypothetical protein
LQKVCLKGGYLYGIWQISDGSKKGGAVAKNARKELEEQTGKSVITGENFLTPSIKKKEIKE